MLVMKCGHKSKIHSVVRHAASANKEASKKYVGKFCDFVNAGGILSQQVFGCDLTGLFWEKKPNMTYITKEDKSMPGHKPEKALSLYFGMRQC